MTPLARSKRNILEAVLAEVDREREQVATLDIGDSLTQKAERLLTSLGDFWSANLGVLSAANEAGIYTPVPGGSSFDHSDSETAQSMRHLNEYSYAEPLVKQFKEQQKLGLINNKLNAEQVAWYHAAVFFQLMTQLPSDFAVSRTMDNLAPVLAYHATHRNLV